MLLKVVHKPLLLQIVTWCVTKSSTVPGWLGRKAFEFEQACRVILLVKTSCNHGDILVELAPVWTLLYSLIKRIPQSGLW